MTLWGFLREKLNPFSATKALARISEGVKNLHLLRYVREVGIFHAGHILTLHRPQAMTAPFVIRLRAFANDVIFPSSLAKKMSDDTKLPKFSAWTKTWASHPSVTYVWEEKYLVDRIVERLPAAKKKYAST